MERGRGGGPHTAHLLFRHQLLAIDEGGRGGGTLDGTAPTDGVLGHGAHATPRCPAEEVIHQAEAHQRRHER